MSERPGTIFFDAVGTLIHLSRPVGEHYREVALRFGLDVDADVLDRQFRRCWKAAPPRAATSGPRPADDKDWWRELVQRVLDDAVPEADLAAFDFEHYFEAVYAHFAEPGVWAAYPEALGVLRELRARSTRLGVISNFDRRLYAVLDHLGIKTFFEHIIVSSEVGTDKPDPAIFRYALRIFGVDASDALHVGDDPARDRGAEAVGMRVFLVERPEGSLRDLLPLVTPI